MDEFTERLRAIDQDKLKVYLSALQAPCYESQLMKLVFPEMDISRTRPLTLYHNHFLLFHVLYQLQDELYNEGQYLFVHCMRTMVVPYPDEGTCRFFEENLMRFCEAPCDSDSYYCHFHRGKIGDTTLEELSVKSFYLDSQNYYRLDEETAVAFINGAWEILRHYEAYKKSFEILGIPETSDVILIKKAFRRLAKKYHPDRGARSHEKFNEINNAYQLLMHILPVLK